MKLRHVLAPLAIVFSTSLVTLAGCDVLGPTKMANGQLYQSGDARFDGYFAAVHQEQVAAAQWPDDAKASRKPVLTALDLHGTASNTQILSAARGKRTDASLGGPIAQTTTSELERARRLNATAARLDELKKRGEELRNETENERKNLGAFKADEKKSEKKREVDREMSAAVDAVETMAANARKGASEAEELAAKLKSSWTGKAEDERPAAKPEPKAAEEKRESKTEKKKPAAAAPAPAPAPAPKPTGEVFNP